MSYEPWTPTEEDVKEMFLTPMSEAEAIDLRAYESKEDAWHRYREQQKKADQAVALREAANWAAGGLHCADMFVAPASTVNWLRKRADWIEAGA